MPVQPIGAEMTTENMLAMVYRMDLADDTCMCT